MNNEGVLQSNSLGFVETSPILNSYGKNILERVDAPLGYTRIPVSIESFESYLRSLPLKPDGSPVRYYDGKVKLNNNIYIAVIDYPLNTENVQMSTDAVIRLISEYLYHKKEYEKIVFHAEKKRISFEDYAQGDYSRKNFDAYLVYVMREVSTPSFCADLKSIKLEDIRIGDIFVQNTRPNGHAVIVVDIVENRKGERLFLLAQGFHPAQDIQIIANPNQEEISPWYTLKEGELLTPEWRFMTTDLMRFKFLEP
ncbi:MAG: DUF4846 domain-containing protein [Weeksellaceae bacterium]|jgi:hypothetical protein|nr:DUF4846 domain-containing protein [Weeksellaceae bacterium]